MSVVTEHAAPNVTYAPGHGPEPCTEWQDAQHIQWQFANICFAVAFLLPNHIKYHLLILRIAITLGSLLLSTWGGTIVCHPDIPVWYTIFFVINLCHVTYILYMMYPFRFSAELRNIWNKMFNPLKVSRYLFTKLIKQGSIETLNKGNNYNSQDGRSVAILLSGRLKAMHEGTFLHYIEPSSFVDSPEFEAYSNKEKRDAEHQVTVMAIEESRLIIWNREALDKFFKNEAFLEAVFHNLIGKDITSKLYQVQDLLTKNDGEGTPADKPKSVVGFRHRMSVSLERQESLTGSKGDLTQANES